MKIKDRLEFIDQCVAGEKTRFQELLSTKVFDSFDRGYTLFRDYIKQKNSITDLSCEVVDNTLTLHITSDLPMDTLLSENIPKKGITAVSTNNGMDLNINIIDINEILKGDD